MIYNNSSVQEKKNFDKVLIITGTSSFITCHNINCLGAEIHIIEAIN